MSRFRPPLAATTALALTAFAANSILCRLALGERMIDAASFTSIRLASGALFLLLIVRSRTPAGPAASGSWASAVWMVVYAVPFSFAYLNLSAGTGALILFGAVQITMIGAAIVSGTSPSLRQAAGILSAAGGLAFLVWPGLSAPSPAGAALMAAAGVAWGAYSLGGRSARDPLARTAGNFMRAAPLALAVSVFFHARLDVRATGALLAAASGAITSGLGYVVWYAALARLSAVRAAVVQLTVPILAAAGGVLFLGEAVTPRLGVAAVLVLGGVGMALLGRDAV